MTELAESVAFGGSWDLEWKCPHEHQKQKFEERAEDVEEDYEEDAYSLNNEFAEQRAQHDLKNKSSKLGTALGDKPEPSTTVNGGSHDITVAAHHLIPGNASLKPSPILNYVTKTKGKIAENIGYNVNSAPNGVWLPGWYAISGWGALRLSDNAFCTEYVKACMRETRTQFHDTHPLYSEDVKRKLASLVVKIENTGQALCDECKKIKENDGLLPPPYGLVGELDRLSGSYRRRLRAGAKWRAPIVTSSTWEDVILAMSF